MKRVLVSGLLALGAHAQYDEANLVDNNPPAGSNPTQHLSYYSDADASRIPPWIKEEPYAVKFFKNGN